MTNAKVIRRAILRQLRERYGVRRTELSAELNAGSQPVPPEPRPDARAQAKRRAEIGAMLAELSQHHGVSDEQLAKLIGCTSEEIAEQRERAVAIATERAEPIEPEPERPPAAPV